MKKSLSIMAIVVFSGPTMVQAAKKSSLETLTAINCRAMAVQHALNKVGKDWGKDSVGILHVDRSISYGTEIDPAKGEIAGHSNVSVVISRESADPVQYEMIIQGSITKGSTRPKCHVIKEIQRDML